MVSSWNDDNIAKFEAASWVPSDRGGSAVFV